MNPEGPRTGDLNTQEIEAMRDRIRSLERTEAALREAAATHQRILDALPDLVCAQDRDGRFLHVNRAFCEFYGKAPEELIGAADRTLVLAKSREDHEERRARVIASSIFIDIPSERLKQPSGTELPFNVSWSPVKDAAGRVEAIVTRARGLRGDVVEQQETGIRSATHTQALLLLDVTGLSSVTTETAGALVRCAQAVSLLGARALMTGMRPDVAQTLATMNIDLGGIVTLSTLKAGIAYALSTGRRSAAKDR